ncbi:unnamed protein product [Rangifer tarandus platyrhynchus]|uniref:Uncharacterized protein n=1 Tax=Rangifer tarandus platyrhynchus TaxID=3082113 RepID=A0ABN8XYC4_RANTA|nr:unnamed protein product [Rangifer tarandus platyrhynchus]
MASAAVTHTRQTDVKQENSLSLVQEAGAAGDGRVGTHRAVRPSSWAEVPKASLGRRSGWVRGRAGPGVGTPGGREKAAERGSEREAEGAQAVLGADCEPRGWRSALGRSAGHPRAQGVESNRLRSWEPYRWAGKTHSPGREGLADARDRNERSDRLPGGRRPDLGGGSGTDPSSLGPSHRDPGAHVARLGPWHALPGNLGFGVSTHRPGEGGTKAPSTSTDVRANTCGSAASAHARLLARREPLALRVDLPARHFIVSLVLGAPVPGKALGAPLAIFYR